MTDLEVEEETPDMNIEYVQMPDGQMNRMMTAKVIVAEYINEYLLDEFELEDEVTTGDVYIVWFCKTLQNWKALLSTDLTDDGIYFEVTFDGDKSRAYLDHYWKSTNTVVRLSAINSMSA